MKEFLEALFGIFALLFWGAIFSVFGFKSEAVATFLQGEVDDATRV